MSVTKLVEVSVSIDPTLYAALRGHADVNGRSLSRTMRGGLWTYLHDYLYDPTAPYHDLYGETPAERDTEELPPSPHTRVIPTPSPAEIQALYAAVCRAFSPYLRRIRAKARRRSATHRPGRRRGTGRGKGRKRGPAPKRNDATVNLCVSPTMLVLLGRHKDPSLGLPWVSQSELLRASSRLFCAEHVFRWVRPTSALDHPTGFVLTPEARQIVNGAGEEEDTTGA